MTDGTNAFEIVYSASLLGPAKEPRGLEGADVRHGGARHSMVDRGRAGCHCVHPRPPASIRSSRRRWQSRRASCWKAATRSPPRRDEPTPRVAQAAVRRATSIATSGAVPVTLPVLDLDRVGRRPCAGGNDRGQANRRVAVHGRDGLEYDFRPVVKHGDPEIPKWLPQRSTRSRIDDQMAAVFPLGGVVVAELAEALEIVAPRPVAVVMPNDDRLGQFRAMFAGRVGMLTVHADEREGNRAGFGGYSQIISSDSLYLRSRTEPGTTIDDRYFLRARLLDALVERLGPPFRPVALGAARHRRLDQVARHSRRSRLGIQPDRRDGRPW